MATSNDQLTTISYGLTRIAEELIAEREFDSSKITLFGNPSVSTTGILSSLSETQGASYEGLSFTESDVVLVSIEGTIGELSTSELSQCLWSFKSTNDSNLTVYLDENSMTVSFKNSSGTQRSILTKDDIPYDASLIFNAGVAKINRKYVMIFRNDYGTDEAGKLHGRKSHQGMADTHCRKQIHKRAEVCKDTQESAYRRGAGEHTLRPRKGKRI